MRSLPALVVVALTVGVGPAHAQTLRGSTSTMEYQHDIARDHDYTFLRTASDVQRFVDLGLLVRVPDSRYYLLHNVSYPYTRPALALFIDRLGAQHYAACGEPLVVTSLTRPIREQPRNASDLSVHPAGMAVDLRAAIAPACRSWLVSVLLSLEGQGVLDVTLERNPLHYHVAVYPNQYLRYVERVTGGRPATPVPQAPAARSARSAEPEQEAETTAPAADGVKVTQVSHTVRHGESLWEIARANDLTVAELRQLNGISGSSIMPGQTLLLEAPTSAAAAEEEAPEQDEAPAASSEARSQVSDAVDADDLAGDEEAVTPEPEPARVAQTSHTVQRGESLWTIARDNDITVDALRRANGINGSAIKAGQTILVPVLVDEGESVVDGALSGARLELVDYRVRSGDSLWTIARRYGTSVETLKQLNDLSGSSIKAGQVLTVPTGISSR